MGLASEFKEFAMKGNVVDLAVGVIIGAAFGKIVSSMVGDVVMPAMGKIIGDMNFSDLAISLGADPSGKAVLIKYGAFIQTIVDFVDHRDRALHVHQGHQQAQEAGACGGGAVPAAPPRSEVLLEEIRDLLAKRAWSSQWLLHREFASAACARCSHCYRLRCVGRRSASPPPQGVWIGKGQFGFLARMATAMPNPSTAISTCCVTRRMEK